MLVTTLVGFLEPSGSFAKVATLVMFVPSKTVGVTRVVKVTVTFCVLVTSPRQWIALSAPLQKQSPLVHVGEPTTDVLSGMASNRSAS